MRREEQVQDFESGLDVDSEEKFRLLAGAYTGCVPRDFWRTKDEDIEHNREAFDGDVARYCEKLHRARRKGYGLLLMGENGTGKSIFASWVLMRAIEAGYSAYYTTMPDFDHNLKRGFGDRVLSERLEWCLSSDFVAIDELAKEQFKEGDSFSRVQLERVLKSRFDNRLPTLLATNATREELAKTYGESIGSILDGKYREIVLDPGDFREKLRQRMDDDLYA